MLKNVANAVQANGRNELWAKALKDLDAEIAASKTLTDAEKKYLLEEMDTISDDEWEPISVIGEPLSETVIRDRGER